MDNKQNASYQAGQATGQTKVSLSLFLLLHISYQFVEIYVKDLYISKFI